MEVERCKNCTYYSAYYIQEGSGYAKLSKGYCRKQDKQQPQRETCEEFISNERKELSREKRRLKQLDRAAEAIVQISLILKEKQSEDR